MSTAPMTERERLIAFLHHMGIELPLLDDVFDAMLIVWKGAKEDMSEHVRIDQFKIEAKVDEAQVKAQEVVALVNMLQAAKADQAAEINWIAVEDRLPETTRVKLVWSARGVDIATYNGEIVGWLDEHACETVGVSHWAELSDINPPEQISFKE